MLTQEPQHLNFEPPTKLAVYRHAYGLSQESLSELTGGAVSRSSIANIESGANDPSPATAGRLAAALNLPVEELFPQSGHSANTQPRNAKGPAATGPSANTFPRRKTRED